MWVGLRTGCAEHDACFDYVDWRGDHRRQRAGGARRNRSDRARLEQCPRGASALLSIVMDRAAQVLEQGELHGREGQVPCRECRVASPQLRGLFLKFPKSDEGRIVTIETAGRLGDHLRILLQDFGRSEDET